MVVTFLADEAGAPSEADCAGWLAHPPAQSAARATATTRSCMLTRSQTRVTGARFPMHAHRHERAAGQRHEPDVQAAQSPSPGVLRQGEG